MKKIKSAKTKLGNEICLLGNEHVLRYAQKDALTLVIGVFHGDEPQGKYLIEEYLNYPSSKSKISVLPQGEDIENSQKRNLTPLAKNLRNNSTKHEIILWQHLKNKQINGLKFRRQQPIGNYIADFVCFEKKMIIELDGGQHNKTENIQYDNNRSIMLENIGYNVIRIWNNEILANIEGVIEYIKKSTLCPPLEGGPKSLISRRGNQLLFIPCLNPDGMQLGTRTNSNGVDLNRNFPTKNWELGEKTISEVGETSCTQVGCEEKNQFFGGHEPASEIETQFLIDTIEEFKPDTILTLHAPYKVVNYDGPAKELAEKISEIMDYPVEKSIGYPTPGSFGTYAGIERNIKTITLELDETCPIEDLISPVHRVFDIL